MNWASLPGVSVTPPRPPAPLPVSPVAVARLHHDGMTQKQIAEVLDCHQSTVSKVLRRKLGIRKRKFARRGGGK